MGQEPAGAEDDFEVLVSQWPATCQVGEAGWPMSHRDCCFPGARITCMCVLFRRDSGH